MVLAPGQFPSTHFTKFYHGPDKNQLRPPGLLLRLHNVPFAEGDAQPRQCLVDRQGSNGDVPLGQCPSVAVLVSPRERPVDGPIFRLSLGRGLFRIMFISRALILSGPEPSLDLAGGTGRKIDIEVCPPWEAPFPHLEEQSSGDLGRRCVLHLSSL